MRPARRRVAVAVAEPAGRQAAAEAAVRPARRPAAVAVAGQRVAGGGGGSGAASASAGRRWWRSQRVARRRRRHRCGQRVERRGRWRRRRSEWVDRRRRRQRVVQVGERIVDHVARGGSGQRAAAGRPGTLALTRKHALGDGDLLFLGGEIGSGRKLAAAVASPGARRELKSTVVSVAGVDGPVAAGFASGDLIPFTVGGGVRLSGEGEASGADDRAREGDLRDVYGRCSGLSMPSTHRCADVLSSAPARSAVGFGLERLPGRRRRNDAGFTPRNRIGSKSASSADRWVPRLRPNCSSLAAARLDGARRDRDTAGHPIEVEGLG